jgi:hypothetical protein
MKCSLEKNCYQENKKYNGNPIDGYGYMKDTFSDLTIPENCHRLCQGIPFCVAWTWTGLDCSLNLKSDDLMYKNKKVAGLRECQR